ncbi:MAG TPA: WecB/TagA/CpsF family glycosyltransferase [Armatimonadota bacterium]|nr:WecB/TagA/CpsF family glycosyltransferase [Armatimonadota bacterium]
MPATLTLSKPTEIPTIDLLGMKVSRVDRAEALRLLQEFIDSGEPHLVVTADASGHVIASKDPEFLRIVNERAALVTPDSTGILWAAKKLGAPLQERVSGVDLAEQLCAGSARRGYGVYFYGAAPGVAEEAAETMRQRYPGCRIVGTADGFQNSPEQQAALLADIRAKRPAVLLVAMGIPKQEKWIARHLEELRVPVCMGVGGSFDVFSGRVDRAPLWMQRRGLEWLYRLAKNPKKYAKVATLPVFVLRVLTGQRLAAS